MSFLYLAENIIGITIPILPNRNISFYIAYNKEIFALKLYYNNMNGCKRMNIYSHSICCWIGSIMFMLSLCDHTKIMLRNIK